MSFVSQIMMALFSSLYPSSSLTQKQEQVILTMTNSSDENNQTSSKTSPGETTGEKEKEIAKQNNPKPSVTLRLMKPEDIPQCLNIFREHELPELSYGLYTYRTLDPLGSWVAESNETGKKLIRTLFYFIFFIHSTKCFL